MSKKRDKKYYIALKQRVKEIEEFIRLNDEQLLLFVKHLRKKIAYYEQNFCKEKNIDSKTKEEIRNCLKEKMTKCTE